MTNLPAYTLLFALAIFAWAAWFFYRQARKKSLIASERANEAAEQSAQMLIRTKLLYEHVFGQGIPQELEEPVKAAEELLAKKCRGC